MNRTHDTGYKELFSHPEFVEVLLDGFIPHQISSLPDYSSLQSHPSHYITPLFDEKTEDAVWSLRFWEPAGPRLYLSSSPRWTQRWHYACCITAHRFITNC